MGGQEMVVAPDSPEPNASLYLPSILQFIFYAFWVLREPGKRSGHQQGLQRAGGHGE